MSSDVAYKPMETIPKLFDGGFIKKPDFIPSYYDWLSYKGEQKSINYGTSSSGNTDLYVVPLGYTFFITNISITHVMNQKTLLNHHAAVLLDSNTLTYVNSLLVSLLSRLTVVAGDDMPSNAIAINFSIPYKIKQEQTLSFYKSQAGDNAHATINGFLVHNSFLQIL